MPDAPVLLAGRYRLGESLGRGGMGQVLLARDETLERDVAIKELYQPLGTDDAASARRTLREARAAARLNHPNVIQVYDVLQLDDRTWIVMEYVPCRSLREEIAEHGPLDPYRVARIGLDLLGALRTAHRLGVEHRDVKPANVLLADDGRVLLTDFGIAAVDDDGVISRSDILVGSPQFMAPERAQSGASGPEADLWSLGATLYAAVEGQAPYQRGSTMATLMALTTEEPTPPQRAGAIRPLLEGLLRKDPATRMTAEDAEALARGIITGLSGSEEAPADERPAPTGLAGFVASLPAAFRIPRPRSSGDPKPSARTDGSAGSAARAVGAGSSGTPFSRKSRGTGRSAGPTDGADPADGSHGAAVIGASPAADDKSAAEPSADSSDAAGAPDDSPGGGHAVDLSPAAGAESDTGSEPDDVGSPAGVAGGSGSGLGAAGSSPAVGDSGNGPGDVGSPSAAGVVDDSGSEPGDAGSSLAVGDSGSGPGEADSAAAGVADDAGTGVDGGDSPSAEGGPGSEKPGADSPSEDGSDGDDSAAAGNAADSGGSGPNAGSSDEAEAAGDAAGTGPVEAGPVEAGSGEAGSHAVVEAGAAAGSDTLVDEPVTEPAENPVARGQGVVPRQRRPGVPDGDAPVAAAEGGGWIAATGNDRSRRRLIVVAAGLAVTVAAGAVWAVNAAGGDSPGARPTPTAAAASSAASPGAPAGDAAQAPQPSTAPSTDQNTGPSTGQSASAAPGLSPSTSPGAGGRPPLPAGWVDYKDKTGFSVYVPEGWTRSQRGTIVYFRSGGKILGFDQSDEPKSDPVADWRSQQRYRVANGDFPGYKEIKIESVPFFRKAADWEFTFNRDGVRKHVNNRGAVISDNKAHGFYWETPDADWNDSRDDLQLIFDSFVPAKS